MVEVWGKKFLQSHFFFPFVWQDTVWLPPELSTFSGGLRKLLEGLPATCHQLTHSVCPTLQRCQHHLLTGPSAGLRAARRSRHSVLTQTQTRWASTTVGSQSVEDQEGGGIRFGKETLPVTPAQPGLLWICNFPQSLRHTERSRSQQLG